MNHRPDPLGAAANGSFPGEPATPTTFSSSPRLLSPEQYDSSPITNVPATLELATEIPVSTTVWEASMTIPDGNCALDRMKQLILQGHQGMPPTEPLPLRGTRWDVHEYQILSAALGTPDLFLLAASDPELPRRLIEQALHTSHRVLVVGKSSLALNRLAEELARDHRDKLAWSGNPDDSTADHSQTRTVPTLAMLKEAIQHTAVQPSRDAESCAIQQQALCEQALPMLQLLREESPDLPALERQIEELRLASEQLQDRVAQEAATPGDSPFSRRMESLRQAWQEERLGTEAAIRDAQDSLARYEKDLANFRHESRSRPEPARPRVLGFLKGWFSSASAAATATLERSLAHDELEKTCQDLQETLDRLQAELATIDHRYEQQRHEYCDEECSARASRFRESLHHLADRQQQAYARLGKVSECLCQLGVPGWETPCPDAALMQAWWEELQSRREQALASRSVAVQDRQRILEELSPRLRQGMSGIRGVFATPEDLGDPVLAALSHSESPGFDMVVILDAEKFTESEGHRTLEFGSRAILIGHTHTVCSCMTSPIPPESSSRSWFSDLWRLLHKAEWRWEGGSLVACLADRDQQDRVWTEPLADRPDIVLHFSESACGDEIRLNAIAFPPDMTMTEAKKVLAQELGEYRINPFGLPNISESDDQIVFSWAPTSTDIPATERVELAPGVVEEFLACHAGPRTVAIRMKKAAGWTRDRAADWVDNQTRTARRTRTAIIPAQDCVPRTSSP